MKNPLYITSLVGSVLGFGLFMPLTSFAATITPDPVNYSDVPAYGCLDSLHKVILFDAVTHAQSPGGAACDNTTRTLSADFGTPTPGSYILVETSNFAGACTVEDNTLEDCVADGNYVGQDEICIATTCGGGGGGDATTTAATTTPFTIQEGIAWMALWIVWAGIIAALVNAI